VKHFLKSTIYTNQLDPRMANRIFTEDEVLRIGLLCAGFKSAAACGEVRLYYYEEHEIVCELPTQKLILKISAT
jgi:hypothetical protein